MVDSMSHPTRVYDETYHAEAGTAWAGAVLLVMIFALALASAYGLHQIVGALWFWGGVAFLAGTAVSERLAPRRKKTVFRNFHHRP